MSYCCNTVVVQMATVRQDGSSNCRWQINPGGMDDSDEELASDKEPASDDDGFLVICLPHPIVLLTLTKKSY